MGLSPIIVTLLGARATGVISWCLRPRGQNHLSSPPPMHATQSRSPRRSTSPRAIGACLVAAGLMVSCADDDDPVSTLRVPTVARFAPSAGVVPVPNDLLFAGSADGTLNIPIADPTNTSDPAIALNTLDGWSTTGPIAIEFTRPVDPATVVAGSSIFLFEVTAFADADQPVGGPVISVDTELQEGVDFAVAIPPEGGGSTVVIQPLQPLAPSTPVSGGNSVYMVIVTNAVTDTDGEPVQRDTEYLFASVPMLGQDPTPPESLVRLNGLINSQLNAFDAVPTIAVPREDVVMSFTFTTQSVGAGLQTVLGIASGNEQVIIDNLCAILGTCGADTGLNPFSTPLINQVNSPTSFLGTAEELLGGAPGSGEANVYAGIFKAPYYLEASMNASFAGVTNDDASITVPWRSRYAADAGDTDRNVTRFNPLPVATSCQQIPLLISVPEDTVANPQPMDGWPVVIFQHGIGGNRAAMLFVAEALAAEGLACVAMDLPLHGREFNEPLPSGLDIFVGYDNALPQTDDVWERTFGIDLLTETPGQLPSPGPDGAPDSSGAHFINLSNLAVTRDNIRQAVSDLINLKAALATLQVQGADVIDETQVHFMGHSLGGIVGTPFVANQPDLVAASLGMAGGSLPYLLNGSVSFGPVVRGGLAAAGIVEGTPEFSQFLAAAQAIVDGADPINYAGLIAAQATPIYFSEIVGGGPGGGVADLVVPNTVAGAPFAGSTPLTQVMGLTQVSAAVVGDPNLKAVVRFIEGNHSTLLAPNLVAPPTAAETAAFLELQAQIAGFHGSGGQDIPVTDTTVVQ